MKVKRSVQVEIKFVDVTGKSQTSRLYGFPARIFQHEYDHLEGVSFAKTYCFGDHNIAMLIN